MFLPVAIYDVFSVSDAIMHQTLQELHISTLMGLIHPPGIVKGIHHPLLHLYFEFGDAFFLVSNVLHFQGHATFSLIKSQNKLHQKFPTFL
jgi:hypothetical protein